MVNLQSKKVLFILPHHDYRDKEYTWIVERLDEVGIAHEVASSHASEAQGRFGTIVVPDVTLSYVSSGDYDAFIFVGEEAAREYYGQPDAVKIATDAISTRKLVAAIGYAVPILGYTAHLNGRKVTGPDDSRADLENTGAFFTGRLVEQDGDIITANGPYAVRELAETLIKALEWADKSELSGRTFLR
jgi:putative intracellular protease/amidase